MNEMAASAAPGSSTAGIGTMSRHGETHQQGPDRAGGGVERVPVRAEPGRVD